MQDKGFVHLQKRKFEQSTCGILTETKRKKSEEKVKLAAKLCYSTDTQLPSSISI